MVVPTSIEYHSVDLLSADDAKSFPVISLSFLFLLLYHHLHHHVILYVCMYVWFSSSLVAFSVYVSCALTASVCSLTSLFISQRV